MSVISSYINTIKGKIKIFTGGIICADTNTDTITGLTGYYHFIGENKTVRYAIVNIISGSYDSSIIELEPENKEAEDAAEDIGFFKGRKYLQANSQWDMWRKTYVMHESK